MPIRTFRFFPFTLDVENACLVRDGARLELSPKDFALLHHLVAHRGRLVPHAELLGTVWRDTAVGPDVLKARVRRLRRILGDDAGAPRFIASVHGEGYRFVAPVVGSPFGAGERAQLPLPKSPPMIGRETELAALVDLLAETESGLRRIACVTGEPGIGKTSLIDGLVARASAVSPAAWIARGQCIEHFGSGEPYLPVLDALARLARTEAQEPLEAALRRYAPSWLLDLPALLQSSERSALQQQGLAPSLERRLRELAEALEALTTTSFAGADPPLLVLVLEDLHWADPSTIDLIAMLARRSDPARLLVVASYRPLGPEHPLRALLPELRAHAAITEIPVRSLPEMGIVQYLDACFPGNTFSAQLAPLLHQRTDGNPLFFTDVVRDLQAREVIARTGVGWTYRGDVETVRRAIPASFSHLVEKQRAASSAEERRLLGAASVAGLEFSAATVAAALAESPADVEEQGFRLAEDERFLRVLGTEDWPDGTRAVRFGFRHALHREIWYERIPTNRRREWHLRIAERKLAAYGERASEIAAELALHFEEGRDPHRALACHEQASAHAFQRSATSEARAHLGRAFELLREVGDTPQRLVQEAQLQLRLGTLLALTEGYTSAGATGAFRRAHEICRQIGDAPGLFDSVGGLFRSFMTQDSKISRALGEQLLQIAEQSCDRTRLMAAHSVLGQSLLFGGELVDSLAHEKLGRELSHEHWNDDLLPVYGVHLGLNCVSVMASACQLLGHPDQASRFCDELLEGIGEHSHPFVSAQALWGAAFFHQIRGDAARVWEFADALLRRAPPQAPPELLRFAEVWLGWALIVRGQPAAGLTRVRSGVASFFGVGVALFEPYALGLLADGHLRLGRVQEARAALDQALAVAERNGPGWYDAELHRLDGELRIEPEEAEACFRQALEVAGRQHAKSWELRAALSLADLWRRQGRESEARELVSETRGWFTEGFDTPDLRQARTFLEARSPA